MRAATWTEISALQHAVKSSSFSLHSTANQLLVQSASGRCRKNVSRCSPNPSSPSLSLLLTPLCKHTRRALPGNRRGGKKIPFQHNNKGENDCLFGEEAKPSRTRRLKRVSGKEMGAVAPLLPYSPSSLSLPRYPARQPRGGRVPDRRQKIETTSVK